MYNMCIFFVTKQKIIRNFPTCSEAVLNSPIVVLLAKSCFRLKTLPESVVRRSGSMGERADSGVMIAERGNVAVEGVCCRWKFPVRI